MEVFILGRRNKPHWFEKIKPTKVDGQGAIRTEYYKSYLEDMIKGLFKYKIPLSWNDDYLLDLLLFGGYVVITRTSAGVMPIESSLTGYNYTNFPTKVIASLPVLGDFKRTLGIDAELLYLSWSRQRGFFNFQETVRIYSEKLASADCAIDVNVMNSRLSYIAEAETKAQARTIQKMFDDITNGSPLVVYRTDSVSPKQMNLMTNNLKQNYIANDIQDTKRTIINELLTRLGVNNSNTDKKERLITDEVNSNTEELSININNFTNRIEKCSTKINNMFTDLNFEFGFMYDSRTREVNERDIIRTRGTMENT